jgi:CHASE3 domain sensor protein
MPHIRILYNLFKMTPLLADLHLISTMTDAETGQRGLMITNSPDYLEPYNLIVKDIDLQLGNLNMSMIHESN